MLCDTCNSNNIWPTRQAFRGFMCINAHVQCDNCNKKLSGACGVCEKATKFLVSATDVTKDSTPLQTQADSAPLAAEKTVNKCVPKFTLDRSLCKERATFRVQTQPELPPSVAENIAKKCVPKITVARSTYEERDKFPVKPEAQSVPSADKNTAKNCVSKFTRRNSMYEEKDKLLVETQKQTVPLAAGDTTKNCVPKFTGGKSMYEERVKLPEETQKQSAPLTAENTAKNCVPKFTPARSTYEESAKFSKQPLAAENTTMKFVSIFTPAKSTYEESAKVSIQSWEESELSSAEDIAKNYVPKFSVARSTYEEGDKFPQKTQPESVRLPAESTPKICFSVRRSAYGVEEKFPVKTWSQSTPSAAENTAKICVPKPTPGKTICDLSEVIPPLPKSLIPTIIGNNTAFNEEPSSSKGSSMIYPNYHENPKSSLLTSSATSIVTQTINTHRDQTNNSEDLSIVNVIVNKLQQSSLLCPKNHKESNVRYFAPSSTSIITQTDPAEILYRGPENERNPQHTLEPPQILKPENEVSQQKLGPVCSDISMICRAHCECPIKGKQREFHILSCPPDMLNKVYHIRVNFVKNWKENYEDLAFLYNPIICPDFICQRMFFFSDFVTHFSANHLKVPMEYIVPKNIKHFVLHPAENNFNEIKIHKVYLISEWFRSSGEYKDVPIMIASGRIPLTDILNYRPKEPSAYRNEPYPLMIWIYGIITENVPVQITFSINGGVGTSLHIVRSSGVYDMRKSRTLRDIYASGLAIVLTDIEMANVTQNGAHPINIQLYMH